MNPAQLLNPKAFAKEQAAKTKAAKRTPNYGPKQTRKEPTKGNKAGSAPGPPDIDTNSNISNPSPAAQLNGDHEQVSMSSLLPGYSNTVEREASFTRGPKRSGEDDEGDAEVKKAKVSHSNTGSSGMLGDHLKEARRKQAADASTPGTIDLTADDDDVVITGGTAKPKRNLDDEIVCIGMLPCRANIHRVPASGNFLGKEHWPRTKIALRRGASQASRDAIVELVDKNDTAFGRIAIVQADALAQLMAGSHVSGFKIKAWLPSRKRGSPENVGDAVSQSIKVDTILYCKNSSTLKVGRYLSQKQLFLSTPTQVDNGRDGVTRVINPQVPQAYQNQQIGSSSARPAYGATTRTVEQITQDVSSMFDGLVTNEQLPEKEANPEIISTPLLAHQKQGLHFLTDHESHDETLQDSKNAAKFSLWKSTTKVSGRDVWYNVITGQELREKPEPVYGGILADMMGLGKTLSILSLVAATVSDAHAFKIKQPSNELQEKGVRRNAQATLIICPTSVLSNWTEQIAAHVRKGKLSYCVYHGPSRIQDVQQLAKYDVVFTTYGTVASEWSDALKKKKALASLHWFRIVLDEAHTVRNSTTRSAKGACALNAQRRWAVTGTPVQNRLEDLGALIRFLRIKPFDEASSWAQYIIAPFKLGDEMVIPNLRLLVDSITLRRGKENIGLKGRKEAHHKLKFTPEEQSLYTAFASRSNMQLKGMMRESNVLRGKTYAHVLKSLLRLRMISNHGREMLNEDDLKDLEGMDASNAIELGDEPELEAVSTKKFISPNTAYELLKMQADNDMDFCSKCTRNIASKQGSQNNENDEDSSSDEDEDGDILGYLTPCYHLYCKDCKDKLVETTVPPQLRPDNYHECQVCDSYVRFEFFELSRSEMQSYVEDHEPGVKKLRRATWDPETYSGPSSKVKALLEELEKSRNETAALPPGEPPIRSVVFTEWTSYLDLLEYALEKAGHTFVRLDGSMNVKQRAQVLIDFKTDPAITVLLVSIRAGGQGLNFTAANKVYMMEPQYNPGVEQQAIDRVHRLGQEREVEIVHFIMQGSVEEALLKLQEKKTKLASLSMDKKKTKSEEAKKRIEELRELFK